MSKESIFKKNEELEDSIIIAFLVSLAWCVGKNAPLSFLDSLSLAFPVAIFIHFARRFIYGRKKITDLAVQEQVQFAGNLDDMLPPLYQAGLRLRERIGEYYIFTTNYRLLPREEFVVKEELGYCVLHSKKVLVNYLREQIDLKHLSNKANG